MHPARSLRTQVAPGASGCGGTGNRVTEMIQSTDGAMPAKRPPTRWIVVGGAVLAVALSALAVVTYRTEIRRLATSLVAWVRGPALPAGFASGNGRIEATEYDIATKRPGRIATVAVREGDLVEPAQVLATMDTCDLEADLHEAEAQAAQSREDRRRALAAVTQRE